MNTNDTTVETQAQVTSPAENDGLKTTDTPSAEIKVENNQETIEDKPYRTFATQADFDRHSAGILNSAKNKAEKEILAMLGLKPDEKDKLAKFKDAYDATLSESEKRAKTLESLSAQVSELTKQLAEKEAVITALTKSTGKSSGDVEKYVKMAKGLVDDNTDMSMALDQVFAMLKKTETSVPKSKPLNEGVSKVQEVNPFMKDTENITQQGRLITNDRMKAREMYHQAYGKYPSW